MTKPSREEYEDVAYIIDNGGTLTGRGRQVAAAALRIAAEQVGEREKVVAGIRAAALTHAEAATEIEREIAPQDYNLDSHTHRMIEEALYTIASAIEAGDHSSATPVSGWRSMDSAPRDGSRFLWAGDNGEYAKARWIYAVIFWPEYADCFDAGVWQPLPSPPGGGT